MDATDLIRIFFDTYNLYYRESLLGFIILSFLSLTVLILFIVFVSILKDNFSFKRIIRYLTIIIILFLLHYFFVLYGEQLFLSFGKDELGILITKFEGPDLSDMYGDFGIRTKIKNEIMHQADNELRKNVQIKFSNEVFEDHNEALEFKNKQNAKILLWGYTERGEDSLMLVMKFEGSLRKILKPSFTISDSMLIKFSNMQNINISTKKGERSLKITNAIERNAFAVLIDLSIKQNDFENALKYLDLYKKRISNLTEVDSIFTLFFKQYCNYQIEDWIECIKLAMQLDSLYNSIDDFPGSFLSANYQQIGFCYLSLGDTSRAIEAYYKTLEYDSRNAAANLNLSKIFNARGDLNSSIDFVRSGLEHNSQHVVLLKMAAFTSFKIKDYWASIDYTKKALDLDPDTTFKRKYLEMIINAFRNLEIYDSSLVYFGKLENELGTLDEILEFKRILLLVEADDFDKAQILLNEKIKEFNCFYLLYGQMAKKLNSIGEKENANNFLQLYLEHDYSERKKCADKYNFDLDNLENIILRKN